MEPFIHCRVSLEINNGHMESLNASYVKLLAVKVTPKWMGVNGMQTAGEGLITNGDPPREASVSGWWISPLVSAINSLLSISTTQSTSSYSGPNRKTMVLHITNKSVDQCKTLRSYICIYVYYSCNYIFFFIYAYMHRHACLAPPSLVPHDSVLHHLNDCGSWNSKYMKWHHK